MLITAIYSTHMHLLLREVYSSSVNEILTPFPQSLAILCSVILATSHGLSCPSPKNMPYLLCLFMLAAEKAYLEVRFSVVLLLYRNCNNSNKTKQKKIYNCKIRVHCLSQNNCLVKSIIYQATLYGCANQMISPLYFQHPVSYI